MREAIAVVGLGYVGLPVALAFAQKGYKTVGYDANPTRIDELKASLDRTGESDAGELRDAKLTYTSDPDAMRGSSFFIIGVPTPVDVGKKPDLSMLLSATEAVGKVIGTGAVVVFESTVFPGCTEEVCGPLLAKVSGLKQGVDFKLGYSPERINPGDREHSLQKVVKVVSGEDEEALERTARAYGDIVDAGVFRAASIKVAEAAKVIENTQRDINIALMNELAIIFEKMDIRTADVLAAARTKWNFLNFTPGLVGGHCIGVDPFYLTYKSDLLGYHPHVILAGRRINDEMGKYIAQRLVKLSINHGLPTKSAKVGILGITFKENVSDLRNSRVPDIIAELNQFGINPLVTDPLADSNACVQEYGIGLTPWDEMNELDTMVLAVPHQAYRDMGTIALLGKLKPRGLLLDVKSMIDPADVPSGVVYSSL